MAIKISQDVMNVLNQATIDGNNLQLIGQLNRKVYVEVNKVLESAGGKWNRKAKAHIFDCNAIEVIEPILMTGEYSRIKQDFGQFDSPEPVVETLMKLADVQPNMAVLEPSAGIGNIVKALNTKSALVTAIELDKKRYKYLQDNVDLIDSYNIDFLDFEPNEGRKFDRVIMNPPFAKQMDIKHVLHAHKFLKPNGVLCSIMSAAITFRENKLTSDFREYLYSNGGIIDALPENSFKDSGTNVNSCIVIIP